MTLARPLFLLVLVVALPVVLYVARHGRRAVPLRQHRIAVGMRVAGVVLIALSLAGPGLVRTSSDRAVLFLLDRSASVTTDVRQAQDAYVRDAAAGAGPRDRLAVGVFGAELRLDTALSENVVYTGARTVVDESATDLAAALRGGAAILPTEGSRRIIVLTDAVETLGNARAAAAELADAGVSVDVVVLDTGRTADALVTAVDAPTTARIGDEVDIEVEVTSTLSGEATISLDVDGVVQRVTATLEPGVNTVGFTVPATEAGAMVVTASVDAVGDRVPQNDTGQAIVRVLGPAQVAVVEGRLGEADDLARALTAAGVEVSRFTNIPTADELIGFDGVVLVNVASPPDEQTNDLASFVEDFGRGLVVVGGDQAFGLGGYQDGPLEALLPVTSDPDDLLRRQPVAEVLVIDTSGSMADCHCGSGGDHDPSEQGGINKTDISRAGAALAIDALQDQDRVGVLAFTSGTRWALPLGVKPDQATIEAALATLTPQGDTEISPALRAALEELKNAPEEIKHIVLFTDGWGDDPDLFEAAREVAQAGITLSVLGTGEGTGDALRRTAALGGGQYYPGRDLQSIPEIFVEETLRVARPLIAEGAFVPALGAASQVTAGLTATPPLRGYVLTRPKATASLPLEIGPGDPLLATWQRGLGRASTWTSDATVRWSADWVEWDGFVEFWGAVVADVLPPGREAPPSVRIDGGFLEITFDAEAPLDAVGVAQIRSSDGDVVQVPMQRSTETRFEARVPIEEAGAQWVAVRVETPTGLVAGGSNGVVSGYAREFALSDPNDDLAADVAEVTDGRVDPLPIQAFDLTPNRGSATSELWPLLAALALALFMADVALRRIIVARGDVAEWRKTLTRAPRRVEAIATDDPVQLGGDEETAAPVPDADEAGRREMLPEEETLSQLLRRKRRS